MPDERTIAGAAACLRAAGLAEPATHTLAARVAATLEQLRHQAEALPPAVEPAVTFAAEPRPARKL